MVIETSQNGGDEFTKEEVEARTAKILSREPRMDPQEAEQYAIRGLREKYEKLSAGAGDSR
jgi:hypothetical protein